MARWISFPREKSRRVSSSLEEADLAEFASSIEELELPV
jgi:hypothetical protein